MYYKIKTIIKARPDKYLDNILVKFLNFVFLSDPTRAKLQL